MSPWPKSGTWKNVWVQWQSPLVWLQARILLHEQTPCTRPGHRAKGFSVLPCDLENLANAVKFIMKVCEEAGLYCELDDGSVLGIWFLKIISWEPKVIRDYLNLTIRSEKITFPSSADCEQNLNQSVATCPSRSSHASSAFFPRFKRVLPAPQARSTRASCPSIGLFLLWVFIDSLSIHPSFDWK